CRRSSSTSGMTRSPTTSFRSESGNGAIVIFAFVAVVTITPLKHKGWSWMTYAGALTYPLYLIHEQWGRWVIGLVNPVAGKWAAALMSRPEPSSRTHSTDQPGFPPISETRGSRL